MDLTSSQQATFKADILANQAAEAAAQDIDAIVAYYNADSATSLWRPSISVDELNTAIVWAEFAGFTAVKQNCYLAMIQGKIDATKPNIRNGFSTIFSAQNSASLVNLTTLAKRIGTRFEVLFSTVDGAANVSSFFGAVVDRNDVINALAS
jgi:hypothetical protein